MKRIILIIAAMLAISMLFYGCGKGDTKTNVIQQPAEQSPQGAAEGAQQDQQPAASGQQQTQSQQPAQQANKPTGFSNNTYTLEYTLADIETFIQQMDYLIGADAPSTDVLIVNDIKTLYISREIDTGDAKLTNEVDSYKENFIIIGSPCDNPAAAALFEKEISQKGSCKIFAPGEARILLKAVSNNDIILYVGGNTPEETKKAAEVIKYPTQYPLAGTEVRVTGAIDDLTVTLVT